MEQEKNLTIDELVDFTDKIMSEIPYILHKEGKCVIQICDSLPIEGKFDQQMFVVYPNKKAYLTMFDEETKTSINGRELTEAEYEIIGIKDYE